MVRKRLPQTGAAGELGPPLNLTLVSLAVMLVVMSPGNCSSALTTHNTSDHSSHYVMTNISEISHDGQLSYEVTHPPIPASIVVKSAEFGRDDNRKSSNLPGNSLNRFLSIMPSTYINPHGKYRTQSFSRKIPHSSSKSDSLLLRNNSKVTSKNNTRRLSRRTQNKGVNKLGFSSVNRSQEYTSGQLRSYDTNPSSERSRNSTTRRGDQISSHPSVPRMMLELFASSHEEGRTPPYNADTVRSFLPLNNVPWQSLSGKCSEDDNRKYEGRGCADANSYPHLPANSPSSFSDSPGVSSYSFSFKLQVPKGEHVRNLLLRLHTIVSRKHSPVGLERRMRVLVERGNVMEKRQVGERSPVGGVRGPVGVRGRVEVARKDVYLHTNAWQSFNIRPALSSMADTHHNLSLVVEIERAFASVGEPGSLELDLTPDVDLQPLLLLYTSTRAHNRSKQQQQQHQFRRQRRSLTESDSSEELSEDELELMTGRKGRRAGRRRRAKNSCKRKPLQVDFASIGWEEWVIAPVEYEAYQCSGKCFYPLASHLNPTKHAVIQTLMHSRSTERARRACCVPTLLGPISLLYMEDSVPTFKKEYGDMVALECGCR